MPRGPQSSPTQELEVRFAVFLNPIRDLTKNWEVDIAKYLEEYLEELAEVQITFDGGETMMNFAEAAMLIQGSATVYSKKVEFLWQMVLQMLDLLSSRRNVEVTDGPVGVKESGGGRGNMDATRDFSSVDDIEEGRNISLKDDEDDEEEEDNRRKAFKPRYLVRSSYTFINDAEGSHLKYVILERKIKRFLPATPLHLVEKEGEKSQNRINLLMKNSEVFGAKDDFRINRSYLSPKGVLCLELPAELLQGSTALENIAEEESEDDADLGEAPVDDAPPPSPSPSPSPSPMEPGEADAASGKSDAEALKSNDEVTKTPEEEMEVEKEKSDMPKETDDDNFDVIDLPNGRYGLRKRGGEKEAIVKLKLSDPWKPIDPHAETPAKRPVRAGRLRKPLPCNCHVRESKPSRARRKSKLKEAEEENKKNEKNLPSIESYITKDLGSFIDSNNMKVPPELSEEANKELSKRLQMSKEKKMKELLKDGTAQDANEAAQRVNEDTRLHQRLDEQLEDLPDGDAAVDLDNDFHDVPEPPLLFPNPHDETRDPDSMGSNKRLNDSGYDEPGSEYEALVQKWVSEYITNAQDTVNSSDLVKRVNKWRKNILPKLDEEERRREFDIHSYGSQVLSFFPENGRKQTIPFHTIAENQEAPEVSRLFLSCLMLANTYNVQLDNTLPGDFTMDCLELTLLSRVRHHEELEEYAAPSQSSPTKRKSRGKTVQKNTALSDEPVINSVESPNICADITHITLTDNIKVANINNVPKNKFKKR